MFDLGMSELLVIGIVALIVIGPKELPGLFRSVGKFTGKMRAMAREFSRAMEAAADEAGVKDVARDLKEATSAKSMGLDKVREAADKFQKWDPVKNAARPTTPAANPTLSAAPKPPEPLAEAVAEAPVVPAPATAGPETAALAAKVAERKAIATDAAEKLRATRAPAAPSEPASTDAAPAVKRAGRTRSAAKAKTTDEPA